MCPVAALRTGAGQRGRSRRLRMQNVIKYPSPEQDLAVPTRLGDTGDAIRAMVLAESRNVLGEVDLDCASTATVPLQPALRG